MLGLMGQELSGLVWILVIINLAITVFCLYWVVRLKRRFRAALGDLDSQQNLAQTLADYFHKLGVTAKTLDNLKTSYQHLAAIGAHSIQKIGIVRFNPFRDTGSDQSFVLALLDNQDNGFLMTSIHGREGTRIYVKSIAYGASKYQLSAEESKAMKEAMKPPAREPAHA